METVVGFILLAIIIIFMLWGKVLAVPIIVGVPFIAALICGYTPAEIGGFMLDGQSNVSELVLLFAFAILYFSVLNDVGVFDLLINKLIKKMGNHPWMVFLVTAGVAAIAHLDGSGATTVAITIPLMLPIYKKMKLNPAAIVLFIGLAAGLINFMPWTAGSLGLSAAIGSNAQEVWKSLIPTQIVGAILIVILCFIIGRLEIKKGAGLSNEEFEQMRQELDRPVELKVSNRILIFDIVFTVILVVALLLSWLPAAACFMLGFSVILVTNFKGAKEQMNLILRNGGNALNMMLVMMGIGAFIGILSNTNMLSGMVAAILSIMPETLGTHLVFIVALLAPIITMAIGNITMGQTLAPILVGVVVAFGATANNLAAAFMIGQSMAANLSFLVPSAYLALGLAGIDMGQNIKYSFKWIILINTILVFVAAITGAFSF